MVARKEAIMNNVRTELAVANAQELVNVSTMMVFSHRNTLKFVF